MNAPAYSCVLFGLDGTLVDTLADIAAAMNHALAKHGQPPLEPEAYRPLVGNGIRRLAYDALPERAKADALAQAVAAEAARYYAEHPADYARPYPGIVQAVGELKRRKVKTAVLSNKPDAVTQLVIAALFPAELFDGVAGERPGVARKPDPESSWELLAALDRTPRQTMFVGDSEVDMQTARNIGCLPVGVRWGFRTAAAIKEAGAALILNRPEEILLTALGKDRPGV
jgi:phosphoglycolate phosphatase